MHVSRLRIYKYCDKNCGHHIRVSIVVSIPACHAGDPGSIPGHGALFVSFFFQKLYYF